MQTDRHSIIYVSSATEIYTAERTRNNLKITRKEHLTKNITGILIFAAGNILVMLEGDKKEIDLSYRKGMEQGHHSFIKLYGKPIPQRFFEDYPMAVKVVNFEEWKSLDDFVTAEKKQYLNECINLPHPAMKVLKDFIKNNA